MEKLKSFKGDKTWQELLLDYALYIILVIMIIGVIVADPTFLSINNFWKILAAASGLPPIANMFLPRVVLFHTNHITMAQITMK